MFLTSLLSQRVENLFERGLLRAVLLDTELGFAVFEQAEDSADRKLVSTNFERVRVAVVFDKGEL